LQQVSALPANTLELKDIHLPEQISNYPVAYGWWLLGILIIFILLFTVVKIRKAAKRNRVKKQALAQLKNNIQITNNDMIALLKWAAMHYFSRAELAKLFGDSLKEFLVSKLVAKHQQRFSDLSEQAFINQYQAHSEINDSQSDYALSNEKLRQATTLWLTNALPPKPLKKSTKVVNTSQNKNQGVIA